MSEIKVPTDLWEDDNEAVITSWLVDDGAEVAAGDLVAEIMVEKAQHEITAPASGTIRLGKEADEVVAKGDVIAVIE
ncbi:lipoyl domain-containing protein [Arhodomonas sp. AD133]|uniref:lipoyl domain-containing protein n=1 Tax=Arhodomonas sp. AD133 TaxID=3415009 RepID=UPI003EB8E832